MNASPRWSDLGARVVSGVAMALVAVFCVWVGGFVFTGLISLICALILWELVLMLAPAAALHALGLGLVGALSMLAAALAPMLLALPMLLIPAALGWFWLRRAAFVAFALLVMAAGYGMILIRSDFGGIWLVWLVLVVVATDIAGYFAGRMLGGAKFWPSISPKKTWSGTAGGWIAAAVVGLVFTAFLPGGMGLVLLSVATSFASQMGDIAQSAVKRRAGVKDSSALIPGHGGVFDRMDGMLGGATLVLVVMALTGYPPGAL